MSDIKTTPTITSAMSLYTIASVKIRSRRARLRLRSARYPGKAYAKRYLVWLLLIAFVTSVEYSENYEVCFTGLGCFAGSFLSCHHREPTSPVEINTTFTLFTKATQATTGEDISEANHSILSQSSFDPRRETKVLIHGYRETRKNKMWIAMRNNLLLTDVNVIMVDWSKVAFTLDYLQSRADIRVVGAQVARLLRMLHRGAAESYHRVHLIGHSLGAHASGYVGEALGGLVGRISGLDPAGPMFQGSFGQPKCRLDKSDALYVDVIHTDGEFLLAGGFGLMDELGHQDFYPNGGETQLGCNPLNIVCDHMRAVHFYIESTPPAAARHFACLKRARTWVDMLAGNYLNCSDRHALACPTMGHWAHRSRGDGVFYVETNGRPPYSQS